MKSTTHSIVINTGPIISLVVSTGSLEWLPNLYQHIFIPFEVALEIEAGWPDNQETRALRTIQSKVEIEKEAKGIPAFLLRELDIGEASVINAAKVKGIHTVAIDEKSGRRVARIHGLNVTGSMGILLKAKRHGLIPSLSICIQRMREHGIWVSSEIIAGALNEAGEG